MTALTGMPALQARPTWAAWTEMLAGQVEVEGQTGVGDDQAQPAPLQGFEGVPGQDAIEGQIQGRGEGQGGRLGREPGDDPRHGGRQVEIGNAGIVQPFVDPAAQPVEGLGKEAGRRGQTRRKGHKAGPVRVGTIRVRVKAGVETGCFSPPTTCCLVEVINLQIPGARFSAASRSGLGQVRRRRNAQPRAGRARNHCRGPRACSRGWPPGRRPASAWHPGRRGTG